MGVLGLVICFVALNGITRNCGGGGIIKRNCPLREAQFLRYGLQHFLCLLEFAFL